MEKKPGDHDEDCGVVKAGKATPPGTMFFATCTCKKNKKEWTPEDRDAHFAQHEPPGSYGFCWKPYDAPNTLGHMHCTKQPNHTDECGRGTL